VVDAWVDFRRRWRGIDSDDRDDDMSGRDD